MKITKELYQRIKKYCIENSLIEKKDRILIAVSGGPDSVFLLNFMILISEEIGFDYAVCHAEHGIRGKDSIEDQKFVRDLCRSRGIKLYEKSINVPAMRKKNESIEEAARRLRYDFFKEIMKNQEFNKLATGHTFDDNTETILLRLLMGTGTEGILGIKPKFESVIHPLLCVRKKEILSCLEGGEYRIDRTNLKTDFLRNRLRFKVIPVLKEINPLYDEHLQRFAGMVRDEEEVIERLTGECYDNVLRERSEDKIVIDIKELLNLHIAIRRRIIIRAMREVYRGYPGYTVIDKIASINVGGNKLLYFNKLIEIRKEYEKLIINKRVVCNNVKDYLYYLNTPEKSGKIINLKEIDKRLKLNYLNSVERFDKDKIYVDPDKVVFPLVIRNRREGDRVKLPEIGTKKIKDLFIDDKVPLKIRNEVPIIVDRSGEIVGIFRILYGKPNRVSINFMVDEDTKIILVFELI